MNDDRPNWEIHPLRQRVGRDQNAVPPVAEVVFHGLAQRVRKLPVMKGNTPL
jgi:hypothetical protein